ncbi:MAG: matrixin family metalloprotease [Flavobacterium sp.]|nr:MAG: matrixin family metalloprotease [Flavobacterium sp.]
MRLVLLLLLLFIVSCSQGIDNDTIVAIIPYEGISDKKVDLLRDAVAKYYGVNVKILKEEKLPKSAFINVKSPRYRADSIIAIQRREKPEHYDYVLGLTESDISTTKKDKNGKVLLPASRYKDFGIMGLAYCPGKSCIVSGYRLKHKNEEVHFGRFKKVAIHELGHNFGLPHCPDKKCVMTDAVESIKTIDNANFDLCAKCKKALT